MPYLELRKAFHNPSEDARELFERRFADERTLHLDTRINGSQAFVCMAPEIYEAMIEAAHLDKQILRLELSLPGRALDSYRDSCLIDEIVLTNEIEGVRSTRREIGEALERLRKNDRHGRFLGIVQKYALLQSREPIPLRTCADVRALYDDLVLREIEASDPTNAPDGELFRTGPVHVVDRAGIPIHDGIQPESRIQEELKRALATLGDDSLAPLVRISLFHFLFGYIHPFYDGNGRTNRFISSYCISQEYEPIVSLGISYAVKQEIEKYYKGFSVCEHPLNRGDLTPFVIVFSEICVNAMRSLRDALSEKRDRFEDFCERASAAVEERSRGLAEALITATLFTFDGVTIDEMCQAEGVSRQTLYKKLEPFKQAGVLRVENIGRKRYYKLDEGAFLSKGTAL